MKQKILIWGAGKIGRGFLGDLFYQAGYDLVFVDRNEQVVEALNTRPEYTIINCGNDGQCNDVIVSGYTALHMSQKNAIKAKLDECSLMAVAVPPEGFSDLTEMLHAVIVERMSAHSDKTLDIIVCINSLEPAKKLRDELEKKLNSEVNAYCNRYFGFVSALPVGWR
jgi:mannitol-1-phosphate 5-dehydrogenase